MIKRFLIMGLIILAFAIPCAIFVDSPTDLFLNIIWSALVGGITGILWSK